MNYQQFFDELGAICEFERNVPLKIKTTFCIGGKTKAFITPANRQEFCDVILLCNKHFIKYEILGAGSNVLVSDKNLDFVVISTLKLRSCYINDLGFVYAEAGVRLSELIRFLLKNNLAGLEYLVGVPGSVGGAVVMNAGAFGTEIAEFIEYVDVWSNDKVIRLQRKNLFFEYRRSVFTNNKMYAIIGVGFLFKKDSTSNILARMKYAIEVRSKTQNVGFPSAGSIFKKTSELAPAYMIQECGLKGYRCGGAQVSKIHSGYIVNLGSATCQDVLKVVHYVREKVRAKFNVDLELEIILL